MKSFILALALAAATAGTAAAETGRLPEEDLGEMAAGRQRLEAALDAAARQRHPELSVSAEAGFDCWTRGIESGAGDEACRDAFMVAVATLERLREEEAIGLMAAQ